MGIFKAASGAIGGVMADQWLEMYSCESMPNGVLATAGNKQVNENSSNVNGESNIISDGSPIIVNEGQCAIVLEMGKVISVFDTPGENIFHSDKTKSLFSKGGLKSVARQTVERIGYGGDVAVVQHVIYIDMKEQLNNPFSLEFPVRVNDNVTSIDTDANVSVGGVFSFRITDPVVFYKRICKNTTATVYTERIIPQLETELKEAVAEAVANMTKRGVRPYELPSMIKELDAEIINTMTEEWSSLRGFTVVNIAIDNLNVEKKDTDNLKRYQRGSALGNNPSMAAGYFTEAAADSMRDAASNPNAAGGFVGVAAAANMNAQNNPQSQTQNSSLWCCSCGKFNTGNFCESCGAPKN